MPPLCRETQSLGQQMLKEPLVINGLNTSIIYQMYFMFKILVNIYLWSYVYWNYNNKYNQWYKITNFQNIYVVMNIYSITYIIILIQNSAGIIIVQCQIKHVCNLSWRSILSKLEKSLNSIKYTNIYDIYIYIYVIYISCIYKQRDVNPGIMRRDNPGIMRRDNPG